MLVLRLRIRWNVHCYTRWSEMTRGTERDCFMVNERQRARGGPALRFLLSAIPCAVIHARTAMGAIRGVVEVAMAVRDATGDMSARLRRTR
jgi:hypothetical protein